MKPSLATVLGAALISVIAFACGTPEPTGKANSEVNAKKTDHGDAKKAEPKKGEPAAKTDHGDAGAGPGDGQGCMLACVGNDKQLREILTCPDKCIPPGKYDHVNEGKTPNSSDEPDVEIELTPQEQACFDGCWAKEEQLCESAPTSCTKLDQCATRCFPDSETGQSTAQDGPDSSGGDNR